MTTTTRSKRSGPATRGTTTKKPATRKIAAKRAPAKRSTAKRSTAKSSSNTRGTSTAARAAAARTATTRSGTTRVDTNTRRAQPAARRAVRPTGTSAKRQVRAFPVTKIGERNGNVLTITVLALTLFGLVMVLSASSVTSLYDNESPYSLFQKQIVWAALGAVAFVVASRIDYRWLKPVAVPFLLVTVLMLIAVLIPGVGKRINGSSRWLGVGPFVIQPGEFAKLAIVLFTADLLSRRSKQMHRSDLTIRPVLLVVGALSILLLMQPKLGTVIVIAAVSILMLFVAGARLPNLMAWTTAGAALATAAAFGSTYRRERLLAFIDPWADPLDSGLQTIQSQVGIASGGVLGVGLGAGRAKWGFLPYAHSDFIFAIVAEEIGLIGAGALIGGFLLLGLLGIRAALKAPDRFGMLLAAGLTSWLLVQGFMNIAMSIGVMPITGEPLPFVSAGGSSLVTTLAAAGLLTNVARRSKA